MIRKPVYEERVSCKSENQGENYIYTYILTSKIWRAPPPPPMLHLFLFLFIKKIMLDCKFTYNYAKTFMVSEKPRFHYHRLNCIRTIFEFFQFIDLKYLKIRLFIYTRQNKGYCHILYYLSENNTTSYNYGLQNLS